MPSIAPWLPPLLVAVLSFLYGCLRLFILYGASSKARQSCNWMLGACARPSFTGQAQIVTGLVFLTAIAALVWLWIVLQRA